MSELYLNKYSIKQIYKNLNGLTIANGGYKLFDYSNSVKGQYFKVSISDDIGVSLIFEINDGVINLIEAKNLPPKDNSTPPNNSKITITPINNGSSNEVAIWLSIFLDNPKMYIQASNSINNNYYSFDPATATTNDTKTLTLQYAGNDFESTYRSSLIISNSGNNTEITGTIRSYANMKQFYS